MIMKPPTVPRDYVNPPSYDELVHALELIRHATKPEPDDGSHHESAFEIADKALRGKPAAASPAGAPAQMLLFQHADGRYHVQAGPMSGDPGWVRIGPVTVGAPAQEAVAWLYTTKSDSQDTFASTLRPEENDTYYTHRPLYASPPRVPESGAACVAADRAARGAVPLDAVPFLIFYDDADRRPELVTGETAARERFRRISDSWNAHLFVKVASNARDHQSANAALAASPAGPVTIGAPAQEPAARPWPKARDVGRIGDMNEPGRTHLRVGLDGDGDVWVEVWDHPINSEFGKSASIEFCAGGGNGGGQSARTREALIALMVAIEADNAESPRNAWPPKHDAEHSASPTRVPESPLQVLERKGWKIVREGSVVAVHEPSGDIRRVYEDSTVRGTLHALCSAILGTAGTEPGDAA